MAWRTIRRTIEHLSVSAGIGMLCAACGSTPEVAPPDAPPMAVVLGESTEAPSSDRSVEESLSQIVHSSTIVGDRRIVKLDLCNRSTERLVFAYSVEWLDRRGGRVPDRGALWTHMVLPAEASAPVQLIAPGPSAESWRLVATASEDPERE